MPGQQTEQTLQPDTLKKVHPAAQGFSANGLARVEAVVQHGLEAVYPAAVLLVARNGGVVLHHAYGYLDPETRHRPTQRDSLFDLASVTKLFTTTAFMALVRAGRVALETPLVQVLPEFEGRYTIGSTQDPVTQDAVPADPDFAGTTVDTRQITFRHLLTHTSGLAAWQGLFRLYSTPGRPIPLPHQVPAEQRARRIAAIRNQYGFAYLPGKRLLYSDLGLILLGEAVARLSRLPLHESVQHWVLNPLGLTRTTYNPLAGSVSADRIAADSPVAEIAPTEHCAWRGRRCIGEVHDENAASLGGVAGHAGLFSTAWEVAVLGQMYLYRGCYGQARVLDAEWVEQMTRCQADWNDQPRGLGWMLRSQSGSSSGKWFGPRSYGHTGYTGTSLWIDPDRALIVVLLTNRVYNGRDPTGIARLRPALHDAIIEALT
jgi:CubicO group peptidase (beta-lactamase class C family)